MNRRKFLACSLSSIGGLLLKQNNVISGQDALSSCDPFAKVTLGNTGIKASLLGFGTGSRGGGRQSNQTRLGKKTFEALLRTSYERGVRLFDMADLYGSHPYIMPALTGYPRDSYAIVSKIWFSRRGLPEWERPPVETIVQRFLKELKTDYIDLVLLHCVTSSDWPTQLSEQMNGLEKLKQKGIIRAHGVSCHSLPALQACVSESWVDSAHARINPYAVNMDVFFEDEVPQVVTLLNELRKQGKAVIGMKIIGEGKFRNSDEQRNRSIEFVIKSKCVDAMVVGFESVDELDDFTARAKNVRI